MARKKASPPENPYLRRCDCWLEIGTCYCEADTFSSVRFSVLDKQGEVHSRWETLNEAVKDGRKRLPDGFTVFDNLEKRVILTKDNE